MSEGRGANGLRRIVNAVYWVPLYELLSAEGFEVLLVDLSYSHPLRGRPKTDRRDCQWIYRLHGVGLLAAAFGPDEQTCRLRPTCGSGPTWSARAAGMCSTCRRPWS